MLHILGRGNETKTLKFSHYDNIHTKNKPVKRAHYFCIDFLIFELLNKSFAGETHTVNIRRWLTTRKKCVYDAERETFFLAFFS